MHEHIVETYYYEKGNLAAVSRITGVPFKLLKTWIGTHEALREDLVEVQEILDHEIHQLLMNRVSNPKTSKPAWLAFYLRARDPRYKETKQVTKKLEVVITDDTFTGGRKLPRPVTKVLAGEVTKEID